MMNQESMITSSRLMGRYSLSSIYRNPLIRELSSFPTQFINEDARSLERCLGNFFPKVRVFYYNPREIFEPLHLAIAIRYSKRIAEIRIEIENLMAKVRG